MSLEPGARLGHYEIVSPAGAGGMGEVYEAKDTRLDRTVAIKVLPSHLADNEELRSRFEREAKAVSALNHPNVCTLHDIGREGDVDFLVMEYLEGETLAERLKKGALPLADALTIGRQIADALDKAHRAGIVHRDLKPANVMLTKSGAKLLDFGLAKQASTDEDSSGDLSALPTAAKELTAKGAILGTFQYMSPEQLEGEAVSARTDIFALGLVLFEMVTGKKAFEGKSQASLISAIMTAEPPVLSTLQPMSPASLDAIVRTCLQKSPEDRWSSAGDVSRQLGFVTTASPSVAPPPRSASQPFALGVAALVGAGIAALGLSGLRETPRPERPIRRVTIPSPPGMTLGGLELSRDGSTLAFFARDEGGAHLYRRSLDGWESVVVAKARGGLSVSPDGQWVGFRSDAGYQKVSISGGSPTTLTDRLATGAADWGGSGFVVLSGQQGIYVVPENGGDARLVTERAGGAFDPVWLPGGEHLLVNTGQWIEILDIETGARRQLLEGDSPRYSTTGHIVYGRGKTLWAVPFDLDSLTLAGEPVPVVESVARSSYYARYTIDDVGTLAFIPGNNAGRSLIWVDGEGHATPIDLPADDYHTPRLSPDGERVAVSVGEEDGADVWVLELGSGVQRPLTFEGSNVAPAWSADGADVLYVSRLESGDYDLLQKSALGPVAAERILTEKMRFWDISPDGSLVALNETDPNADLYLWNESAGVRALVQAPESFASAPRFDPTGRYLAYVSNATSVWEVHVAAVESDETWIISTGGGRHTVWARDGRTLFYRRGTEMWSVPIEREPEFLPGTPILLFDVPYSRAVQNRTDQFPNYDVAPDGRFLMLQDTVIEESNEIRVVLGFDQLLERLAPTK